MQKNRTVLQITTRLCVGGTCAYLLQLCKALSELSYKPVLVAGKIEKDESDMSYIARELGIEPIYVNNMGRSLNPLNDIISILNIIKIIKKIKPYAVFTHNAKAGVVGRIAAFIMGVPIIVHTYHGNNFSGYFGAVFSRFSIITEQMMAKMSTYLIALSQQQKDDLIRFRIAKQKKIKIVSLGFDIDRITYKSNDKNHIRGKHSISSDKIVVAFIGRFAEIKNPIHFLKIAHTIIKNRNDIVFAMIGDGELKPDIIKYIQLNDIADKIILTGVWHDVRQVYADIDILLLTSKREGTPVAVIEAMANKRVVIASNVGGVPDIIENEYNGFLCDPESTTEFVQKICSYADNPESYIKVGEHAREKILSEFNIKSTAEHIIELIES